MKLTHQLGTLLLTLVSSCIFINCTNNTNNTSVSHKSLKKESTQQAVEPNVEVKKDTLDTVAYNTKVKALANGDTTGKWPVKNTPYPLGGAILPFKRVVCYYGNLYSKKMGALGEYAPKEMLERLDKEIAKWNKLDPTTPVQPALHYIAVVASGNKGKDGKYRNRMPSKQIDSVLAIAKMRKDMIVFLDIQVALSTIQEELPLLEKYLKMPNVHLGMDPEFSMKNGVLPGKKIGTYDASEVNYATQYLADLVKKYNLPPKIFVLHRFTKKMVTNYKNIKLRPEVQVVVHMDGWGDPELKRGSYRYFIYNEPVQFAGIKLFYKNDLKMKPNVMLTPEQILKLKPKPIYIQYQ